DDDAFLDMVADVHSSYTENRHQTAFPESVTASRRRIVLVFSRARLASPETFRSASASRLQAQTVAMMRIIGAIGAHGWKLRKPSSEARIPPHVGAGGCTPMLRKVRLDTTMKPAFMV